MTAKEKIIQAVEALPADTIFEEAMERLLFLAKVDKGIEQADAGEMNLLYFRGQCEKSYLQSNGDMRHDTDRQRESQEVQQRVQG